MLYLHHWSDYMKKSLFKILICVLILTLLTSCDTSKVLRTKDLSDKLTQTTVVTKSNILQQEDYGIFFNNFKNSFTVPGLFEGVIPQGIGYDETNNVFLITGYFEDEELPSMIMCVDGTSGALKSYHTLKNTEGKDFYGHVGGIAVSQNTVYVVNSGECYTMPLTDTTIGGNAPLQFKGKFKLNTQGSFACIHNNVLWVGDFIQSDKEEREKITNLTTLPTGETFYAYCEGYVLQDGLPSVDKINKESNGYIPDYLIAIPEQVQGLAFTKTDKLIFSTSYGRKNNSPLLVFDDILATEKVGTRDIDGKAVDLYACSNNMLISTIEAPPMSEGLAETPDGIYLLFESGAAKYRNGGGKYPVDTVYVTTIE